MGDPDREQRAGVIEYEHIECSRVTSRYKRLVKFIADGIEHGKQPGQPRVRIAEFERPQERQGQHGVTDHMPALIKNIPQYVVLYIV